MAAASNPSYNYGYGINHQRHPMCGSATAAGADNVRNDNDYTNNDTIAPHITNPIRSNEEYNEGTAEKNDSAPIDEMDDEIESSEYIELTKKISHAQANEALVYGKVSVFGQMAYVRVVSEELTTVTVYALPVRLNAINDCLVEIQPLASNTPLPKMRVRIANGDISTMTYEYFATLPQARLLRVLQWPMHFPERVWLSRMNLHDGRKNADEQESKEFRERQAFRDKYTIFVGPHQQQFIIETQKLSKYVKRLVKAHLAHRMDAHRLQEKLKLFEIVLEPNQPDAKDAHGQEATSVRIKTVTYVAKCKTPEQMQQNAHDRQMQDFNQHTQGSNTPKFVQPGIKDCDDKKMKTFLQKVGVKDYRGEQYKWAAIDTHKDHMKEDAFAVSGDSIYYALATPAPYLIHMKAAELESVFGGYALCPVSGYNGASFGKHLLAATLLEACKLNSTSKCKVALVIEVKKSEGGAKVAGVSLGYIGVVHSFTFEDEHRKVPALVAVLDAAYKVLNGATEASLGDELVREELLEQSNDQSKERKGTRIQEAAIRSSILLRTLNRMASGYCGDKMFEKQMPFIAKEERAPIEHHFKNLEHLEAWPAIQEILAKAPQGESKQFDSDYASVLKTVVTEREYNTLLRERKSYMIDAQNYIAQRDFSPKTIHLLPITMLTIGKLMTLNVRDFKLCTGPSTQVWDHVHNRANLAPMGGALRDALSMFNHMTWMQILINDAPPNGVDYHTEQSGNVYPNPPSRQVDLWFPHAAAWDSQVRRVVDQRRHFRSRAREALAEQKLAVAMESSRVFEAIVTSVEGDIKLQNEFWQGSITMQSIQCDSPAKSQRVVNSDGERELRIKFAATQKKWRVFKYGDSVKVCVTGVPHNGQIKMQIEMLFMGDTEHELSEMEKWLPVNGETTAQLWNCLSAFRIEDCTEEYKNAAEFNAAQKHAFQHAVVSNATTEKDEKDEKDQTQKRKSLDVTLTLRRSYSGVLYLEASLKNYESCPTQDNLKQFLAHVWFEDTSDRKSGVKLMNARLWVDSWKTFKEVPTVHLYVNKDFVNERHPQDAEAYETLQKMPLGTQVHARLYPVHYPDWISLQHSWAGTFKGILGGPRQFEKSLPHDREGAFMEWLKRVPHQVNIKDLLSKSDFELLDKFYPGQQDFIHRVIEGSAQESWDGFMPMAVGPAGAGKTAVLQFAIGLLCMLRTDLPKLKTVKPMCILYITQANPAGHKMFTQLTEMRETWPGMQKGQKDIRVMRHVSRRKAMNSKLGAGESTNLRKDFFGESTPNTIFIICTTADLYLMNKHVYAENVVLRGLVIDEVQNLPDPKLLACVEIAHSTRPKDTNVPFTCFAGGDPMQLKAMQTSLLQRNMSMDLLTRALVSYVKRKRLGMPTPDIYPLNQLCRFHHQAHCNMIVKMYEDMFGMEIKCEPVEKDTLRHKILMELPALQTIDCFDEDKNVPGSKSWVNPGQDRELLNHFQQLMPWMDEKGWPEDEDPVSVLFLAAYKGDVHELTRLVGELKGGLSELDRVKFDRRFKIDVVTVESIGGQQADIAYVATTRATTNVSGKPAGLEFWTSDKVVTAVTRQMYMLVVVGCPSWMKKCYDNKFSQVWADMKDCERHEYEKSNNAGSR